jgi:DNA-binding transcriptional ArsR family regulator
MSTATAPRKSRAAAAAKTAAAEFKAAQRAANTLRMGGDVTRVRLMLLLADGERNVGQLVAVIGQSQPATSHHIALLRHGRVLDVRREGKTNVYSLTDVGRSLAETARRLIAEDASR